MLGNETWRAFRSLGLGYVALPDRLNFKVHHCKPGYVYRSSTLRSCIHEQHLHFLRNESWCPCTGDQSPRRFFLDLSRLSVPRFLGGTVEREPERANQGGLHVGHAQRFLRLGRRRVRARVPVRVWARGKRTEARVRVRVRARARASAFSGGWGGEVDACRQCCGRFTHRSAAAQGGSENGRGRMVFVVGISCRGLVRARVAGMEQLVDGAAASRRFAAGCCAVEQQGDDLVRRHESYNTPRPPPPAHLPTTTDLVTACLPSLCRSSSVFFLCSSFSLPRACQATTWFASSSMMWPMVRCSRPSECSVSACWRYGELATRHRTSCRKSAPGGTCCLVSSDFPKYVLKFPKTFSLRISPPVRKSHSASLLATPPPPDDFFLWWLRYGPGQVRRL